MIYFYRNSKAYTILAGVWCDREKPIDLCMVICQLFSEEIRKLYADGNTFLPYSQDKTYMCSNCLTSDNMYSPWCRYSLISFPGLSVGVFTYHGKDYSYYLNLQNPWPQISEKLILFHHFYHGLVIPNVW